MRVSESPDFLESVAHHPRVWPSLSRKGVDKCPIREFWPYSLGFEYETGGWWMVNHLDDVWEVHTLFLPKSKGLTEKAEQVRRVMFCGVGARELLTRIPSDLPHARRLAEAMGFRHRFTRKGVWERESGRVDVHYLGLTRDEWVLSDAGLKASGHEFHQALKSAGFEQDHDDDDVHDAYAGFAVEASRLNNYEHGLAVYNQWARFAGFAQLEYENGRAMFNDIAVRLDHTRIVVEKR